MYRARVEAVDGLKVRAGGKWLTCIGNRTVKAGDMVWTDGRCVYGHDREAQTPLVIANPKEDLAIPIRVGNSLYTFRKGNLELVGEMSSSRFLLNDTKRELYSLNAYAANIDKAGTLYTIRSDYYRLGDENFTNVPDLYAYIKEDNRIVSRIPLSSLLQPSIDVTISEATGIELPEEDIIFDNGDEQSYYHSSMDYLIHGGVSHAFIENHNSWAMIYCASAQIEKHAHTMAKSSGSTEFSWMGSTSLGASYQFDYYYIDSSGNRTLIYRQHYFLISDNQFHKGEYVKAETSGTEEMKKIKYPIQDGYYFQMSHIPVPQNEELILDLVLSVPLVKYDIYSPNEEFLFSRTMPLCANFTICKLGSGKHLVGIKSSPYEITYSDKKGGLYIHSDGVLTPIVEESDNSSCFNYRLRPMKKYKRWWERVQAVD